MFLITPVHPCAVYFSGFDSVYHCLFTSKSDLLKQDVATYRLASTEFANDNKTCYQTHHNMLWAVGTIIRFANKK